MKWIALFTRGLVENSVYIQQNVRPFIRSYELFVSSLSFCPTKKGGLSGA